MKKRMFSIDFLLPSAIIGDEFKKSVDAAFDVLTGKEKAKGKLTYKVNFR